MFIIIIILLLYPLLLNIKSTSLNVLTDKGTAALSYSGSCFIFLQNK
jgi:hypothetical protein